MECHSTNTSFNFYFLKCLILLNFGQNLTMKEHIINSNKSFKSLVLFKLLKVLFAEVLTFYTLNLDVLCLSHYS